MATTIEQQTALDESLVPSSQRLRIGRSNFRLPSDIQSKEATLQVATTKLHHNSIRFKIDTRKSVLDLEAFREMLHISPRIPNQPFADLPTEEEVLDFLRFLGHSHDIRYLTDVNVNKHYQPWRSFASVINKCLTGKSSGVDSFRLSQAQLLWGFYDRINIDFAYLIWEDFVYQMVSLEPPTPIMTPSTIATITTSGEAPTTPPTIPSSILENLPTFNSAFRFEERLRLLETSFYEYRQTNQFADAVSAIPGIVHQYMD
nr:hypothetical protein [Tanacetum cinerariifolium]